MKNYLQRGDRDKKFQKHHLSCLLRMFHFLVYHQKSNMKKLRKSNPLCCQVPKTISLERENADEIQHTNAVLMIDEAALNEIPSGTCIPSPIIILKSTEVENDDGGVKRRHEASDSANDILEVFQVNKKLVLDMFSEPKTAPSSYTKRKIARSGSFPVEKPSTLENKMKETFPHIKPAPESKSRPKISPASPKRRSKKSSVVSYVINLKNKIKRALKHSNAIVEYETTLVRATSHKEFLENCKQLLERSQNYPRMMINEGSGRMMLRSSSLETIRRKPDVEYFVHYDVSELQGSREMHSSNLLNTELESENEEQSPISVLESITKASEGEENLKTEACAMSEVSVSNDPEEKYIGEVLYVSGFAEGENATKWHTMEEPMDPGLYNDVEGLMYGEESGDRREVFDAVNEALVEIFGGALRYFPAEKCAPGGARLVREVRKRVGKMRECGGEELGWGNEWMSLIFDVEDVALDVEDVIFDDLLHETLMTFS